MGSPATDSTIRGLGRLSRAQLEQTTRRIARRVGVDRPTSAAVGAVPVPDSAMAGAAECLLSDASPPTLANHCRRTYAFAALLGARDGLEWDAEILYVAAMLHDLGLTQRASGDVGFELMGATAAHEFVLQRGWAPERAALVHRAIALHLEVGRAVRERPEVALLHLGAAADVTGMRLEDISPDTVAELVERFPRLGFKAYFAERMREEARRRPDSTTAFLCRWGQFAWRIDRAPFDE